MKRTLFVAAALLLTASAWAQEAAQTGPWTLSQCIDYALDHNLSVKQNELTAAINEMRNELAKNKFGKSYADINNEQRNAIDEAIPIAISEAEPKNVGGN